MTELLLKTALLTERQCGYAEKIKTSGESLLVVLNDILDFSKVDWIGKREGPERLPLSGRKNPINIFSMENSHEYNDNIVIFDPNPIISLSNSIIMFIYFI